MRNDTGKQVLRDVYRRLPEGLRRAILVKRRERLWIATGVLFIHVPKAAGTSISQALYGRFMGHMRAADVERWGSAQVRVLPRFAVVRNPWDRLVSAYRFAKRGSGIGGIVAGIRNPEQYRVPEFENFERFVREWLAPRDVRKLDGVFQPQWPFVCQANKQVMVDHVGRFEKLEQTHAFLEATLRRKLRFHRQNLSGPEIDYRSLYTPALAAAVRDIYSEDVEMFGYEF